ncbi:MAG TPA: hypothetical protein PK961_03940 [bacterium]|nr:hypothetical protein [bacterium]
MLRPMTEGDLPSVAQLFCERLPASPLSQMGEAFVGAFIGGFIACPLGMADVEHDGQRVLGFAIASTDAAGTFAWLRENRWAELSSYREAAVTDRARGFWQLLESGAHYHPHYLPEVAAELLFVAVHWDKEGTRLAAGLVRRMLTELRDAGVNQVKIYVGLHNSPPQNMLWALGFERRATFVQDGRELVAYVYSNLAQAPFLT